MPLPKPEKNEKETDFMNRCMDDPVMKDEFPDVKQRNAVCNQQWKDRNKTASTGSIGRLPLLMEYIAGQHWAMEYGTLQQLAHVAERHLQGIHLGIDEIQAITNSKNDQSTIDETYELDRESGTAIIHISGILSKYSRMVNGVSTPRGTSVELLHKQLAEAMADDKVESIFLRIESPGGSTDGINDFANELYQASFEKPIVAFADDNASSAAYWLGSQANVFYATEMAWIGSIGVYAIMVDSSERAKQEGLKFMIFRSGENKGIGEDGIPITAENEAVMQSLVDASNEFFIRTILRGREAAGLEEDNLRQLADGRTILAGDAVKHRLIDGVTTLAGAMTAERPPVRVEPVNIKETIMSKASVESETEVTVNGDQIQRDAATQERERISTITGALSGEALQEVCQKAIAGGMTITEAKAEAFGAMQKYHTEQIAALSAQLTEAKERLAAVAGAGSDVPAPEPTDEIAKSATGEDDGKAETYTAAVNKFLLNGDSKADAVRKAVAVFPKSHEAWKAGLTPTTR